MRAAVAGLVCLALLLTGCFRDPKAVQDADHTRREALRVFAENQRRLHSIEQDAFRREALAHLDTVLRQDLGKLLEKADPVTGLVDSKAAHAWVTEVLAALEKQRTVVDSRVGELRAAVDDAETELKAALKLDEALSKFHAKGVKPEVLNKIVEAVSARVAR